MLAITFSLTSPFNFFFQDFSLGGWSISHSPVGQEPVTFKFHRTVKVEPQATVTVWSSDSNKAHEPPVNIVMKNSKWTVGNEMKTTLTNPSGEVFRLFQSYFLYFFDFFRI